jgi:hypothetical protein
MCRTDDEEGVAGAAGLSAGVGDQECNSSSSEEDIEGDDCLESSSVLSQTSVKDMNISAGLSLQSYAARSFD